MTLLYWFESIRLPALDAFMSLVTRLGEETFFMAAASIILSSGIPACTVCILVPG